MAQAKSRLSVRRESLRGLRRIYRCVLHEAYEPEIRVKFQHSGRSPWQCNASSASRSSSEHWSRHEEPTAGPRINELHVKRHGIPDHCRRLNRSEWTADTDSQAQHRRRLQCCQSAIICS